MATRLAVYRGSLNPANRIAFDKVKTIAEGIEKADSLIEKVQGKFAGHIQVVSDKTGYVHYEKESFEFQKNA